MYILYLFQTREKANLFQAKSKFERFSQSSSKWVIKAAETTCNISNAFGPGTANKHIVQWWFKTFSKGDESLEDEE